ncbi:hypothetical protein [Nonomuraea sp. NPDC049309]|uniref:hypothetical protein n=1 Tax=Nonomuraea sp. NPDC049309 TaxID=3364350 RepID=UPI003713E0F1
MAVLALGTACASNVQPVVAGTPSPSLYQEAALSAEDLAGKVGCKPDMRTKAAELRQGVCKTSVGNYVITSFTTEQGKRDWLDYAQMYGGTYLVGRRWVVTASPAVLETLRKTLGGEVRGEDSGS